MTVIRLSRRGRKNLPFYHITISDKRSKLAGKNIEKLGYYNPISKDFKIDKDRTLYWLKNGSDVSLTVKNLLKKNNIYQEFLKTKSIDTKTKKVKQRKLAKPVKEQKDKKRKKKLIAKKYLLKNKTNKKENKKESVETTKESTNN